MKFMIKAKSSLEAFAGDSVLHMTGESPYFVEIDEIFTERISDTKVKYRIVSEENIKLNKALSKDDIDAYLEALPKVLEKIKAAYGEDALDETNSIFWAKSNRNELRITTDLVKTVFDTDNIDDLILFWNIRAGAYSIVAPSYEVSNRTGARFYVASEEENQEMILEKEVGSKRKAIAALDALLEKGSMDALVYITWNVVEDLYGFTRNTPKSQYETQLMSYIEGKLVKKGIKDCAKNFLSIAKKWSSDKESIIIKGIINAAMYYGYISFRDGVYKTSSGLVVGNTKEQMYDILTKSENFKEFDKVREDTEKALN